jgi:hypothetical protein
MFVVVVLYCVKFFFDVNIFQFPCLLFFSFPLFFLSYFFISILLDFSKRLISQNIWGLIKHHWKTAFKQFFKGIAHEQPWSSILCLLWWTSIVSSFFEVIFFQCPCLLSFSFPLVLLFYFLISILLDFSKPLMSQNPSLLSFARAFVSYLVQFSWPPLLGFYGVSMGFWQNFYGNSVISMVFLWYSMMFLKVCLGSSVGFL